MRLWPLAAVLAISLAAQQSPCNRKLRLGDLKEIAADMVYPTEEAASEIRRCHVADNIAFNEAFRDELDQALKARNPQDRAKITAAIKEEIERNTQPEPPSVQPKGTDVNPKDGQVYVWIPPGKFTMGCSPNDNECDGDERPSHEVTMTKGYWLGQTEVSQGAYRKVTGESPSNFKGDDLPVEQVDWNQAQAYCAKVGGRLPTEAEWEYAARAGDTTARYGEIDKIAWYDNNSGRTTHPVKSKDPNRFGLYNMLGNVWEWVADRYGPYGSAAQSDTKGPPQGEYRSIRGGSWNNDSWVHRASNRYGGVPQVRDHYLGFRCARD